MQADHHRHEASGSLAAPKRALYVKDSPEAEQADAKGERTYRQFRGAMRSLADVHRETGIPIATLRNWALDRRQITARTERWLESARLAEAMRTAEVDRATARKRLARGWTFEEATNEPVRKRVSRGGHE